MATNPEASQQTSAAAETRVGASLLETIVEKGHLGQTPQEKDKGKEWIKELVEQVLVGQIQVDKDTDAMLGERIREIDELISAQLNEVMHSPEFQKLEGAWRGLQYLVSNTDTGTMLKIKVLNVSKKDILKDFTKQNDWEAATIFKKIYEEGYGTLGGEPFGCLVGDYEITRHPEDIQLLTSMSNVAAVAHAPFLTSVSPALFNWDDFRKLAGGTGQNRGLADIFDNDAFVQWRDFRKSDDSRYVGLCLPHILLRLPYGEKTAPGDEFDFGEG